MDLWKTAKPVLERWVDRQIGLRGFVERVKAEAPHWAKLVPTIPRLFAQWLEKSQEDHSSRHEALLVQLISEERKTRRLIMGCILFATGLALGTLFTLVWLS
jgi:ubiquinone biosynthesis protein